VEEMLISLGKEELESILNEDGVAEVVCHFCNEKFRFEGERLQQLIVQLG
jgi:molecular chaperone Hsp33